jgi:hypothetical protein
MKTLINLFVPCLKQRAAKSFMTLSSMTTTTNGYSSTPTSAVSPPLSLEYPSILAPLTSKFSLPYIIVLLLATALTQLQPFGLRFLKVRLLQSVPVLSKIKIKVISSFVGMFIILLGIQEIQLERRLITDFRSITKGFWSNIDNVVLHNIRNKPFYNAATRVHCFHGFGANSLSWESLFKDSSVNFIAHDIPGFGFSPRISSLAGKISFPTIYRPLWNAWASLKIIRDVNTDAVSKLM